MNTVGLAYESALAHRHLTHTVYDSSPQPKNRGWLHRLRVLCLNWLPRQQGGQLSARDVAATMSPWTSPECFYLFDSQSRCSPHRQLHGCLCQCPLSCSMGKLDVQRVLVKNENIGL
jgi:hypothetical protein